ncbi:MAG TPA: hypothetical protein VEU47_08520 [Candidatus Cybelea sp.]|nr:hypothetical protein [Candidatus Cybelea sp.]
MTRSWVTLAAILAALAGGVSAAQAEKKYGPGVTDAEIYRGQTMAHVLRDFGDELTRENPMRHAASIKGLALPMLLPGITINASPTSFYPIRQERLQRFDGNEWVLFGVVIGG